MRLPTGSRRRVLSFIMGYGMEINLVEFLESDLFKVLHSMIVSCNSSANSFRRFIHRMANKSIRLGFVSRSAAWVCLFVCWSRECSPMGDKRAYSMSVKETMIRSEFVCSIRNGNFEAAIAIL